MRARWPHAEERVDAPLRRRVTRRGAPLAALAGRARLTVPPASLSPTRAPVPRVRDVAACCLPSLEQWAFPLRALDQARQTRQVRELRACAPAVLNDEQAKILHASEGVMRA